MRSVRFFAALLAVSVVFATVAGAEPTEVGTTAAINTDAKGTPPRMASRNLFIGTNVFFEERIETSESGQAQLLFLDESALTIASNSDVVLDKFIYDPKTSKGELALSVGAGLFRFVGGRISKTSAVTIKTPTATIGIRGGIAIIEVEPGTNATRATYVFGQEMTVTNDSGVTRRVTRPGFAVDVASKVEEPSSPRQAPPKSSRDQRLRPSGHGRPAPSTAIRAARCKLLMASPVHCSAQHFSTTPTTIRWTSRSSPMPPTAR